MRTNHDLRSQARDVGLLVIRIAIGVVFLFHGSQKLFGVLGGHGIHGFAGFLGQLGVPWPVASAILCAATEFFGGLAVLSGFGTRIATVPMIFNMLVAIIMVHGKAFSAQNGGMEYPLTLALVLLGLGLTGPGALSLSPRALWRRAGSGTLTSSTQGGP